MCVLFEEIGMAIKIKSGFVPQLSGILSQTLTPLGAIAWPMPTPPQTPAT